MKRFFCFCVSLFGLAVNANAQLYRLGTNDDALIVKGKNRSLNYNNSFKLMRPVKLVSPTNEKLGLEAGGPKYTKYIAEKPKIIIEKKTVVKSEVVPVVEDVNVVENINVEVKPVEQVEKKDVAPLVEGEKGNVVSVKSVDEVAQVSSDIEPVPLNVPGSSDDVVADNTTDKNIEEARHLLHVAEKLANSVVEENDVDDDSKMEKGLHNISVLKTDVVKKPEIVLNFKNGSEELSSGDEKKLLDIVPNLMTNSDLTVKIVSYFSNSDERNVAFSRLLNARKVLLEKDVPTSQIMIMVLEDEEKKPPKSNLIEVFFLSAV